MIYQISIKDLLNPEEGTSSIAQLAENNSLTIKQKLQGQFDIVEVQRRECKLNNTRYSLVDLKNIYDDWSPNKEFNITETEANKIAERAESLQATYSVKELPDGKKRVYTVTSDRLIRPTKFAIKSFSKI